MSFIALRGPFLGASYLFLKQNALERPLFCFAQTYPGTVEVWPGLEISGTFISKNTGSSPTIAANQASYGSTSIEYILK